MEAERDLMCYIIGFKDGEQGHRPRNAKNIALRVGKARKWFLP